MNLEGINFLYRQWTTSTLYAFMNHYKYIHWKMEMAKISFMHVNIAGINANIILHKVLLKLHFN